MISQQVKPTNFYKNRFPFITPEKVIIKSNFVRSYSKAAFLLGLVSKLGKHNFPDFSLRLSTVFKGVSVHIFDIFSSSITFHRVPPFFKKKLNAVYKIPLHFAVLIKLAKKICMWITCSPEKFLINQSRKN